MITYTLSKPVNLLQLTDELRALPGLPPTLGLSARGPLDGSGETVIVLHVDGALMTPPVRQAVEEALARHLPDPDWGLPQERRALQELLARPAGSLRPADLEAAVRCLATLMEKAVASMSPQGGEL